MSEKIPVLDLKNVQLCFLDNAASGGQISMMHYEGSIFRPLSVFFNISCKQNAQVFCQNFSLIYGKRCVLLQGNNEYSVWLEVDRPKARAVKNDDGVSQTNPVSSAPTFSNSKPEIKGSQQTKSSSASAPTSSAKKIPLERQTKPSPTFEEPQTKPPTRNGDRAIPINSTDTQKPQLSNTQICLLLIKVISDDIEYLMGTRKKISFEQEIRKIFEQLKLEGWEKFSSANHFLFLNPSEAKQLPNWQEEQVEQLFYRLGYLGIRYFGNTNFLDRAFDTLKEMPFYQSERVLNLYMKFILICKNLTKK